VGLLGPHAKACGIPYSEKYPFSFRMERGDRRFVVMASRDHLHVVVNVQRVDTDETELEGYPSSPEQTAEWYDKFKEEN
jgi:hypothetical protein